MTPNVAVIVGIGVNLGMAIKIMLKGAVGNKIVLIFRFAKTHCLLRFRCYH